MDTLLQRASTPIGFSPATGHGVTFPDGHAGPADLTTVNEDTSRQLVQLFKLLADETRLRIVYYLMQQHEINVRTFCRLLAQSQPAVSHHLALLKEAGAIECRRDGKHNFYRLIPQRWRTYLDALFAVNGDQMRQVRVEDAVLSYGRDGQAS